jgi:uncharacterized protein
VGVPHGEHVGAVAFSSFGAFWIWFFVLVQFNVAGIGSGGGNAHHGLAVYLYAWAIFTTYIFVASLRTTERGFERHRHE